MSADAPVAPAPPGLLADPRDRRVLRYALGATLAMAVAMGFAWSTSGLSLPRIKAEYI